MSKKATDIVAYITIIGWLIAFIFGDRANCRFHLNQGLVLAIAELIVSTLNQWFSGFPGLLMTIISFLLFFIWLAGFIGAIKGEETPVPILGGIRIIK